MPLTSSPAPERLLSNITMIVHSFLLQSPSILVNSSEVVCTGTILVNSVVEEVCQN